MGPTFVLDARSTGAGPCGVERYAHGLVPAVGRRSRGAEIVALVRPGQHRGIAGVRCVACDLVPDGLANLVLGRRAVRRALGRDPDVFHALFHVLPLGAARVWRTVVTFHDDIWLSRPRAAAGTRWRATALGLRGHLGVAPGLRAAHAVICPSEATARAARRVAGVRAQVIAHGLDAGPRASPGSGRRRPAWLATLLPPGAPYYVALASPKPYKGTSLVVRAFADVARRRAEPWLVLYGEPSLHEAQLRAAGVADRVVRLGRLDDDAVAGLVAACRLFVFASTLEGFGFPPLEAMALGAPTAVARIDPVDTLVGGGALRFEPGDAASLRDVMLRALCHDVAAALRPRALEVTSRLTWDRAATQTLDVYERVLRSRDGG